MRKAIMSKDRRYYY